MPQWGPSQCLAMGIRELVLVQTRHVGRSAVVGERKSVPAGVFPSAQPWCKRASPGVLGYAGKPGATGVRGLVPVTTSHLREPETVGLREPDLGGDNASACEARLPYGERGCNGDPAPHASLNSGAGHPHQYSCLENSMDRGAWQATVHGVAKNRIQLSNSAQHTQS